MTLPGRDPATYILPGYRDRFLASYWPGAVAEDVDRCGYDTGAGWNPARCGEEEPCWQHGDLSCWCGARPVTHVCCYAAMLGVCGAPLCAAHQCRTHG